MKRIFVLALAFGFFSCASQRIQAQETGVGRVEIQKKRPSDPDLEYVGLDNLHRIDIRLFRSARPDAKGLMTLMKDFRLKSIVNLENDKSAIEESKQIAKTLGLNHYSFPLNAWDYPKTADIESINTALLDPSNGVTLIHCQHGKDRTGLLAALFRVHQQSWSADDAYNEWKNYGLNGIFFNLKNYFWNHVKQ